MRQFVVTLDDAQYQETKDLAHKTGLSMAEIIRRALWNKKYIEANIMAEIKIRKLSTTEWRNQVNERDNYKCIICGLQLDQHTAIAHHKISRKKGGKNILENGITLCRKCHIEIHENDRKENALLRKATRESAMWRKAFSLNIKKQKKEVRI